LNYFELNSTNRITFSIICYYGAGEIFNPQASICTVDPNPEPFQSRGEAAFVSEIPPVYQWQYSLRDSTSDAVDIPGANDLNYAMPRLSQMEGLGFGKVFFRRAASTVEDAPVYSNVIHITLSPAGDIDQNEFGDMQCYGYVYDKYNS